MHINRLELRNFRCFTHKTVPVDNPLVLITGPNGSGKTSILEALHYACYLRSFRTASSQELCLLSAGNCAIKIAFDETDHTEHHELLVAQEGRKRVVKLDNVAVRSHKELFSHYRAVTIFEDDLLMVKGGPEERRSFLDMALVMADATYGQELKQYRHVLEQRNALLVDRRSDEASGALWANQLWQAATPLVTKRTAFLAALAHQVNQLFATYMQGDSSLSLTYKTRSHDQDADTFFATTFTALANQERLYKRSLFGAHLDDFAIGLNGKIARSFASRGQQKLVIMLLKIAHVQLIEQAMGPSVLLIDDFMADFDPQVGSQILQMLYGLNRQIICSSPHDQGKVERELLAQKALHITL
ncbi:MAG: DNA replication and repair protein RecF [Candidatus Babeliales bacterium]